jgi:hypothetical protein
MADQPLLEVNCTNCPGNQACGDCLVRFFAERDSAVVSLASRGAARRGTSPAWPATAQPTTGPAREPVGDELAAPLGLGLPADLAAAVAALEAAGLEPAVLGVEAHDAARAS